MKYLKISKSLGIGLELEMAFNRTRLPNIYIGQHREGDRNKGLDGWKIEGDGSLNYLGEWKINNQIGSTCEVIMNLTKTKSSWIKRLNSFKTFFSKNSLYELHEVISFNKSCGSHIHFSIGWTPFLTKTPFKIFKRVRKIFFKLVNSSEVLSTETKKSIIEHYFRSYAKRTTLSN